MAAKTEPDLNLSKRVLPKVLQRALEHIFSQGLSGVVLVGGTALSGFYAGHRRSDDLDLFVKDEMSFKTAHLAVQSLKTIGTDISENTHSKQYYNALCKLDEHTFTVDIVLDENLFRIAQPIILDNNVSVVDLSTLLKMKTATLLSRCSEKDLFDLIWLLNHFDESTIENLIEGGLEIDAGLDAELLLYSISTAELREDACDFSMDKTCDPKDIHKQILAFQKQLIRQFQNHLDNLPSDDLKKMVSRIRKL